jgi:hypothetical protein
MHISVGIYAYNYWFLCIYLLVSMLITYICWFQCIIYSFPCSSIICHFGSDNSRAGEVRQYFAIGEDVADSWVQYFVHCLIKDEPKNRLLRKPHERIYLDIEVMMSYFVHL